ncbi:SDR family NAD(P)-dependent oxidoreductase [Azospirillum cavernae]|uniref:SDR family NAD(P)-dependent oxidoreductase n=1 Tax=Azospirillum cavernae TaxID=2320860 RepID=A0A418W230_9PROT|nr:SDR family NAD(P)-dependent oxidoreductase [Azospirillum cavernae]RJF84039.1 SDR family NAD(P)-dependent oxidoreductase [Azospirillum cavernae]
MRRPRSLVITGASSGIGAALALRYAEPGVCLALTGRDAARLAAVAERCRAAGAEVTADVIDATDRDGMAAWLRGVDDRAPVDLLIANAGISAGTGGGVESEEQARRILSVNIDGVLNSVYPLLPRMQDRRRGQIALMASQASFRGFPGAPAYCASKAAVRVFGEALRGDLAGEGIGVSVICPGFVKSRITDANGFSMPFLMEADAAARVIRRGLARNAARVSFPWPVAAAVWLLALLPPGWTDGLLARAPKKG